MFGNTESIAIYRSRLIHYGRIVWYYECVGPDGTRFDNRSIATLRQLLRRRYPGIQIIESWKA